MDPTHEAVMHVVTAVSAVVDLFVVGPPPSLFSSEDVVAVGATLEGKRKKAKRAKEENYVERVVFHSDSDFQSHFRLGRTTAQKLLLLIAPALGRKDGSVGREPVSPVKTLLLSLWILATHISFKDVGDRFGISKGTAHRKFIQFVGVVGSLASELIVWPRGEEVVRTAARFEALKPNDPFPGVIGCVGCTHIKIPPPNEHPASYYYRKGCYSVVLQVVCNSEKKFIDVYCGWAGSVHESRVWKNSPLYSLLSDGMLPEKFHLLGDVAYPVAPFILSPYEDNGQLTQRQKHFNQRLSSTRVIFGQAIGLLKTRFRRLEYLDMACLEKVGQVIFAACVLHNFCIDCGDDWPEEVPPESDKSEFCESEEESDESEFYEPEINERGLEKREKIACSLMEE